jgi:hypothetical protein
MFELMIRDESTKNIGISLQEKIDSEKVNEEVEGR